jgi:NADH-quinone oxidoreductase subunit L
MHNKFYFDQLYDFLFVRPVIWFAEVFTFLWMDRGLIDGILHAIAHFTGVLGSFFRQGIDAPIINGFADLVGDSTKKAGQSLRVIQTGQVQQYMIAALIFVFGTLLFFLYSLP